jgi:hypothetical protein
MGQKLTANLSQGLINQALRTYEGRSFSSTILDLGVRRKRVVQFSLQIFLEIYFSSLIFSEVCVETHLGLHVKWSLNLSDLNENCSG